MVYLQEKNIMTRSNDPSLISVVMMQLLSSSSGDDVVDDDDDDAVNRTYTNILSYQ